MTGRRERDAVACPRCGAALECEFGETVATTFDEELRIPIDCPACDAPLEAVLESALPDALGVDIRIDDRRDDRTDE